MGEGRVSVETRSAHLFSPKRRFVASVLTSRIGSGYYRGRSNVGVDRSTRRLACVVVKRDKFDPADRDAQAALIIVHSQVGGPGGGGADRQLHVGNE